MKEPFYKKMTMNTPTWSRPSSKPPPDLSGGEFGGVQVNGPARIGEALEELLRAFMLSTNVELLINHLRKAVELHLRNHGYAKQGQ